MNEFQPVGKILFFTGAFLVAAGIELFFSDRIPFPVRPPGGLTLKGKNFTFYFPIAASVLLSPILSPIFNLFSQ